MKKSYLLFLFTVISLSAIAQDTLTSADLPSVGSFYVLSSGISFPGLDARLTGSNYNWDYSALEKSSQRIDTMLSPNATNPLLAFYFINSPLNTNRSNLAMKGGNFNLGIIGLQDVFNYYYNSTASFTQPGFGAVIDSLPVPVAYNPHDVLYIFPLKYGDEDSVSFSYSLDLSSTLGIYYQVNRKRQNTVDGWGVLSTPFGIFDVLRIKSMLTEQDSIYVDTFHLGVKTPPVVTYEYKWMGKGYGLPLLQINTNDSNLVSTILYQDSIDLTGVAELPSIENEPVIFPNPASDKIVLAYDMRIEQGVEIGMYDLRGKQIFRMEKSGSTRGKNFLPIDLSPYDLSKENYLLKITSGNSSFTKMVQIE